LEKGPDLNFEKGEDPGFIFKTYRGFFLENSGARDAGLGLQLPGGDFQKSWIWIWEAILTAGLASSSR
jgi:hypothetical protein